MKEKIFLTSAIAMGVIAPAVAAPTYTSDTFPSSGLMQEDYTYTNAATADNMDSVYEGEVNAVAEYEDIFYDIVAGNYLAAGSDDVNGTICPAGSYCSGLTHAPYNATENQGIETCPTGYALSADGASSANECYRTCTTSDVEHSTGVTGGYYYGNNNQCSATGCVNGWHLKEGLDIANIIGNESGSDDYAWINNSGEFGYSGMNSGVVRDATFFNLNTNNHNTWATYYNNGKGMVSGQARCSTVQGVFDFDWSGNKLNQPITTHTTSELGSEGGQYCYCNVTGYTPDGGTLQSLSSSWVFYSDFYGASNCANLCANNCAPTMQNSYSEDLAFRAALLGSVQPTPAMCEANTITINWSNADAEDISANNAGTATYGSDVRTPVKAETIKGKTFKGWRFSNPEKTNLSE